MDGISIELQALEKENTKLSFDTQIGEIKVATGLLIRSRPTFLCAPLSIIARANVQGSTDWRRPVIFRRIRATYPPHPCLVNPKFHFLSFSTILFSPLPSLLFIEFFSPLCFVRGKLFPDSVREFEGNDERITKGMGSCIFGACRECLYIYIYNISIFRVFCELELNEIKETRNESGRIMSN